MSDLSNPNLLQSNRKKDPIMSLNPFVLKDDEWKSKRTEVAVGMTQSKLKAIFPLIKDVARKFSDYIGKQIKENPKKSFEARNICVRYTCDTVATCVFAIDGGSFTKEDSQIIKMADKMILLYHYYYYCPFQSGSLSEGFFKVAYFEEIIMQFDCTYEN